MTENDHELAARLAELAGRHLRTVREDPRFGDPGALKEAGDQSTHELLMRELTSARPADAVLSEHGSAGAEREAGGRVWIVDPLDGTREFGERDRPDWAVHVALAEGERLIAGAVALPARDLVLGTGNPPRPVPPGGTRPVRIAVSRTRPPEFVGTLAAGLGAETVPMGSAGAKISAVLLGEVDAYVHAGGQYEWDSAAPVAIAHAAGFHASRIDGTPLRYNQSSPWLPDLIVCRGDLADPILSRLSTMDLAGR